MYDLFRQYVGTHTDYDERGQITGHTHPLEHWQLLEQHWDGLQFNPMDNPIVGWFEDRTIAAWMAR